MTFTPEDVASTEVSSAQIASVVEMPLTTHQDASVMAAVAPVASVEMVASSVANPHIERGAPIASFASAAASGSPVASSGFASAPAGTAAPRAALPQITAIARSPTIASKRATADGKNKAKSQGDNVASKSTAGNAPTSAKADAYQKGIEKHKGKEDADTALVAAIIARLDRRVPSPESMGAASLANATQKCAIEPDLLASRACVARVCEGHWGKVDACPASRALQQPAARAARRD